MKVYEEILWEGKPKKGFQLVIEDLLILPFLCFFAFILYILTSNSHPVAFLLWFGLIYIIYIRYVQGIINRHYTEYCITPTRVIISVRDELTSIYFSNMNGVNCTEHPFTFKYGSIIFGKEENIFGNPNAPFVLNRQYGLNLERNKTAIEFIKDYKEVYSLIKQNIAKTKPL